MNSKNKISKLFGSLIVILALTFSTSSYAGSDDDDSNSNADSDSSSYDMPSSDDNGSTSIPLDGGLSILLLGAAAFGVKKLRDNKK